MSEIIFPTFFKHGNRYTAMYSKTVCIDVYRSYDNKMATVTVLELNTLGVIEPVLLVSEAEFLAAYRQVQGIIENALHAYNTSLIG